VDKTYENLVNYLNERTKEYDEGNPGISDSEWDKWYYTLIQMEKESGIIHPDSPSHKITYQVVNELKKVKHNHPMLSLEKTKEISEVEAFAANRLVLLMCKMDGLTCSLHYKDGKLISAETRGNGAVGEDILHNAKVIPSIPKTISYTEELVIDGEIICKKDDFKEFAAAYANPRNFAAGSIRLLDSKECAKRKLTFVAWDVIKGYSNIINLSDKLNLIDKLGFTTVPKVQYPALFVDNSPVSIEDAIDHLTDVATNMYYPIDGIVIKYDNIEYGKTMGATEHHFRNALAYKFYDETYKTELKSIEWTMGRTGVLTPIAIFNPIEMDDSVVERASLHNVSIMEQILGTPYVGQELEVFKANMIIPQVKSAEHNGCLLDAITMPTTCPICGEKTYINNNNDVKIRVCGNPDCSGKFINRLEHFCGKKGLDIKGFSLATIEKLVEKSWLNNLIDVFKLSEHRDEWIKMPGFGVKSVDKILNAIETSKNTTLDKFICALGIPLIGSSASKKLVQIYPTWEDFMYSFVLFDRYDEIEGFGPEMDKAITNFDYSEANEIVKYLTFEKNNDIIISESESNLKDKTFVITGSLKHYKNRDELKKAIEANGGKVVSSVSSKTSYLINNDVNSTSSKNVSAKKLNIPILTEEDLIAMLS
jgi:DNA ligase (NAD+)